MSGTDASPANPIHQDGLPRLPAELHWAKYRPKSHRTPLPRAGDRVWYRPNVGMPLAGATVLEVSTPEDCDWNVWRIRTDPATTHPIPDADGQMIRDEHPDAWHSLLLKIDGQASHVITREARLKASAGWLPLDWLQRCYPGPGDQLPVM